MVALKSTSSRCPLATPLHRPSLHYISKGLMGLDERWNDAEQLQPLIWRVEVDQRDDENDRRTHPPTILREQQRSPYRTCVEVGGRTLLRLMKPNVRSAAAGNCPKTARRATQDRPPRRRRRRRSSCADSTKPPFNPIPTAVARPSDAVGGPDRDQPHLLCPPTTAAWAALRGRTIIWHRQTPDRRRVAQPLF